MLGSLAQGRLEDSVDKTPSSTRHEYIAVHRPDERNDRVRTRECDGARERTRCLVEYCRQGERNLRERRIRDCRVARTCDMEVSVSAS